MSDSELRSTSARVRGSEVHASANTPDDAVPRWESWMTLVSIACAIMFVAAWMPRDIARWAVAAGLVLAAVGTVQMFMVMRRSK